MTDDRKAGILLVDDEEPIRKSIKDFLTDRISCDIKEILEGSNKYFPMA
jgi:hypothetical protein